MQRKLNIVALLMILISCTSESQRTDDYLSWVAREDNGLAIRQTVGNRVYRLQYRPAEAIALMEGKRKDWEAHKVTQRIAQIENLKHFNLTLGTKKGRDVLKSDLKNEEEYYQRLHFYSFGLQDKLSLEINGERLACTHYHFERSYDLSNHRTAVLGFETDHDLTQGFRIVIESEQMSEEPIRFDFTREAMQTHLKKLPQSV